MSINILFWKDGKNRICMECMDKTSEQKSSSSEFMLGILFGVATSSLIDGITKLYDWLGKDAKIASEMSTIFLMLVTAFSILAMIIYMNISKRNVALMVLTALVVILIPIGAMYILV